MVLGGAQWCAVVLSGALWWSVVRGGGGGARELFLWVGL